MTRQTCQAYELTDDITYAISNGKVQKIVKAFTVFDRTTLIDGNGDSWRIVSSTPIELATEAEAAEYERDLDRQAVAGALMALGKKIVDRRLPVPPEGKRVVVSLYLADDADLEPWADYLSTRPRRGTALPLIQADAEGVEINVYRSGEFGPDLADPGTVAQEFGPMYADDLSDVAQSLADAGKTLASTVERDGWAPPSGHSVTADEEALRFSREGN